MRILHALMMGVLLFALAVGCNSSSPSSGEPNAKVVTLEVTGMTCIDGCAASVRDTLASQKGVSNVEVDFAAKKAKFSIAQEGYDEKAVLKAVEDAGFSAKVVR